VEIEIFILEHTPVHDKYDFCLHTLLCTIAIGAGRERESVCEEITVSACKVSSLEIIAGIIYILTHKMYHIIIWIELQNFVPLVRIQHH
jgi:hypothetical protein